MAAAPPMAAPQPPAPAAAPNYAPTAPARGMNPGLIIAGVVGAIAVLIAILYFTGAFDRKTLPRMRPATPYGSSSSTSNLPPPPSLPSTSSGMSRLAGTWGPRCPASTQDAVSFTSDGSFSAGAGRGTYTFVGNMLTLYRPGASSSFAMRWEFVSDSMARATNLRSGTTDTIYRCS